MKNNATTPTADSTPNVLYMAMELSNKKWLLGFGKGDLKFREKSVDAGDLSGVMEEIEKAKRKFGLPEESKVVSCYEAGRDGFWKHRKLLELGVENTVADSSSIEVNRRYYNNIQSHTSYTRQDSKSYGSGAVTGSTQQDYSNLGQLRITVAIIGLVPLLALPLLRQQERSPASVPACDTFSRSN